MKFRNFARLFELAFGVLLVLGSTAANAAERKFSIFGFDTIRITGNVNVEVVSGTGTATSALASADTKRILDRLSLRNNGKELLIGMGTDTDNKDRYSVAAPVNLRLTTSALKKVVHLGSGSVNIDKLSGRDTLARLVGFGNLAIGSVDSDMIDISLNGGGTLSIGGKTRDARVSLRGAGNFDGGSLSARKLVLNQRGPGHSLMAVERDVEITNQGSGLIEIIGRPRCLVRSAGSAQIICNPTR